MTCTVCHAAVPTGDDTCPRCLAPAPSAQERPRLVLTYQITGERIEIDGAERVVLGRESYGADVLGKVPQLSARHCVIEYTGATYVVTDMRSTHGTFIGSSSCVAAPQPLPDGATLYLGREPFVVRYVGAASAEPERPVDARASAEGRRCSGCHEPILAEDVTEVPGGLVHTRCGTFNTD